MTREDSTAVLMSDVPQARLSDEAAAAKALLVEHFRGRGGLPAALAAYRQRHPEAGPEDAILGLFSEACA